MAAASFTLDFTPSPSNGGAAPPRAVVRPAAAGASGGYEVVLTGYATEAAAHAAAAAALSVSDLGAARDHLASARDSLRSGDGEGAKGKKKRDADAPARPAKKARAVDPDKPLPTDAPSLLSQYLHQRGKACDFKETGVKGGLPPFVGEVKVESVFHRGAEANTKSGARANAADAFFQALLRVEPDNADPYVIQWRRCCSKDVTDELARAGLAEREATPPWRRETVTADRDRFGLMRSYLKELRNKKAAADAVLTPAECQLVLAREKNSTLSAHLHHVASIAVRHDDATKQWRLVALSAAGEVIHVFSTTNLKWPLDGLKDVSL